jgi:AcrR family transcriptional regulator
VPTLQTGGRTSTPRGQRRRQRILDATAELVAARGFHAVGVAEIGAAAGVTGSAIYRHFANKEEVLVALVERVVDELLRGARSVIRESSQADQALDALIRAHAEFAVRDRAIIAVYDQEIDNLPPDERRRLRRQQRIYVDLWTDVLAQLRRATERHAVVASVHAVFGLLNSVADYQARIPDDVLIVLLTDMARASLARPR